MQYVVEEDGAVRSADDLEFANKIVKLAKTKDVWCVIDELVKMWLKKSPEEVEAVKIDIKDQKEILVDKKYGQTAGGVDMERRFQILFPTRLMSLIRAIYKAEVLPFDRKFYKEFATRYPGFKVSEKV